MEVNPSSDGHVSPPPIKCICLPSPSNLQMTNKNKIFYSKVRGCFVSTLVSGRQYGTVSTLVAST